MTSSRIRLIVAVPLAALPLALAAGCSSDNASCNGTSCTITFDRGVDAKASILGVDAELVSVNGQNVTLKLAGQQLTIPLDTDQTSGNFNLHVSSVTKDQVVVTV